MRNFWRKAILWYLVIGALFYFCVDYRKVAVKLLNAWYWLPRSVWETVSSKKKPDRCMVRRGIRYYRNFSFMLPVNAEAHSALGFLEYHQGRLEASRKAFQKALALNADLPGLRYDLAVVLLKEGQREKALELFKQEIEALPRVRASGPLAVPDICSDGEAPSQCLVRATYQNILWLSQGGDDQGPGAESRQPLFYHLPMRQVLQDGHSTLVY
jgi:tetratricopeptide (TPR) repeat protein